MQFTVLINRQFVAESAAMFVPTRNLSESTSLSTESQEDCQAIEAETQKRKHRHDMRNELNSASLAIHLLQKQIQIGRMKDAEESLKLAVESISRLDQLIDEQE